jgi:hypothetical protein
LEVNHVPNDCNQVQFDGAAEILCFPAVHASNTRGRICVALLYMCAAGYIGGHCPATHTRQCF